MKMRQQYGRRAFTLLEGLVVVAVDSIGFMNAHLEATGGGIERIAYKRHTAGKKRATPNSLVF